MVVDEVSCSWLVDRLAALSGSLRHESQVKLNTGSLSVEPRDNGYDAARTAVTVVIKEAFVEIELSHIIFYFQKLQNTPPGQYSRLPSLSSAPDIPLPLLQASWYTSTSS